MTDANYADDLTLLASTPTQVESLLNGQEQAESIDLYVNANKTVYIRFKQKGLISTLKLMDQFILL